MTDIMLFAILIGISSLLFMNWRKAILLCAVWIILEGAFRKWFMPGYERQIYFLKDFIIIIVYAKFFNTRKAKLIRNSPAQQAVKSLLVALFIWSALGMINPEFSNPLINLFGLKQFFVFVPLLIVIPRLFEDKQSLFAFIKFYSLIFIPVGILGVVQFLSSPGSPINRYVAESDVASIGAHARITGPFSYMSGYGAYLTFLVALGMGYLGRKMKLRETMVILSILFFVLLNILMTASRGPFLVAMIVIASYVLILSWKTKKTVQKVIVGIILSGLVVLYFAPIYLQGIEVLTSRGTGDVLSRIKQPFVELFGAAENVSVTGHGIGATQKGTIPLLGRQFRKRYQYFESEPSRVMFEIGIIGCILYYLVKILIVVAGWKTYKKLKDLELKSIALPMTFLLLLQVTSQTAFDHIGNFYFWFGTAILFTLRALDVDRRKDLPTGNKVLR